MDNAIVINVCSRSAKNDITAHLAEFSKIGFNYRHVVIPALDDQDVSYWPEKYSEEWLKRRRESNLINFSSYFQQYLDGEEWFKRRRESNLINF